VSIRVLERHEMKIECEDDIILVRKKVKDLAKTCAFNVFATSAITTAASELARNVWVHARKGAAVVEKWRIQHGQLHGTRSIGQPPTGR
jgi:anti-sigma regulatory factor (Ser/Thr protein kinase)